MADKESATEKKGTEIEIVIFPESVSTTHCSHGNRDCILQLKKDELDAKGRLLGKIYHCFFHKKDSFFMCDTSVTYK